MRILVTGGSGVVGEPLVTELVRRGHQVRLVARHASRDAGQWPHGVEPRDVDIGDGAAVWKMADGCDAVLHAAAVERESPPEGTFERVNVGGTRNVLAEAARAGVRRLVYVSSLGADTGESGYHRSKRESEEIVRGFAGNWTICRVSNVYGAGDQVISVLLQWLRVLPAIPVVDDGDQPFQPVWAEDAARALAACVERDDLGGRVLEIAGTERTSMNDVIERLGRITGRDPVRVPVPHFLATLGLRAAEAVGLDLPVDSQQVTMLREGSVVEHPEDNALVTLLGVTPTPLDEGLRTLARVQPEQLPEEGVGSLERKRFWGDIAGSTMSAESLLDELRRRFSEITPWTMDLETPEGTPRGMDEGETVTMELPLRGRIQVRVVEVAPGRITLVTLRGHPLAGVVRFLCEPRADLVRFEVQVYDRSGSMADWLAMHTVGSQVQSSTWMELVENVAAASGGRLVGEVESEQDVLDDAEAGEVEAWVRELVQRHKREKRAAE